MQYVSPWIRFLSLCIDLAVLRICLDLISFLSPATWLTDKKIAYILFFAGIFFAYILTRIILGGQTFGMWILGYKILKNSKSKRLTLFEELLRFVSQWISALLLFLPFAYALFNKKHAHFSDLVVDSSPQVFPGRFSSGKPLQKLIGVLLFSMALTSLFSIFSKSPAVDLFARIIKGDPARFVHGGLFLVCLMGAGLNLIGNKRAAAYSMLFFLMLTVSSLWAVINFDAYNRRVIQNFETSVNAMITPNGSSMNDKLFKTFLSETQVQISKSLKPTLWGNIAMNPLYALYMLSIIFERQVNAQLKRFFEILKNLFERLRMTFTRPKEKSQ